MNRLLEIYRMGEDEAGTFLFWTKEIVVALLILLLFWLISRIVRYVLIRWAPRFTSFTATDLDDRILARVTPPICLLVMMAGMYFSVSSLPVPDRAKIVSSGIVFIACVAIMTNIGYRTLNELLAWFAERHDERLGISDTRQFLPLLQKLVTIFLIGSALIVILKHFNYDILSLVTALGIGSLAIGMAAKDTLANMISGFTLMIDRPFRIGDRIQLAGGQFGDVVDIGLRSTKIKTMDNTLLIIPNSDLCNSTVINMAFPDNRTKGRINVGVAYGSDVDRVKAILVDTALGVPEVMRDPRPEAYFTGFGDSALNMSLFFWVENYPRVFPVTDLINTQILGRFANEGISIPFPTRSIHVEKDR